MRRKDFHDLTSHNAVIEFARSIVRRRRGCEIEQTSVHDDGRGTLVLRMKNDQTAISYHLVEDRERIEKILTNLLEG